MIAVNFRDRAIFTPLVMWQPLGTKAPQITTGRESLPGHVNQNTIGLRQKYVTATYTDSRERALVANLRYGGKIQFDVSVGTAI